MSSAMNSARIPAGVRRFGLDRQRLPTPANYYTGIGLKLTGVGEWRSAVCPFHDDTRPSLRVRIDCGAFRCMVCGAHGGDVIEFERLRSGRCFIEVVKAFGAWREDRR